MTNYTAHTLWLARDGATIICRTIVVLEDVDGQPLGLEVTEEPYVPEVPWPGEQP